MSCCSDSFHRLYDNNASTTVLHRDILNVIVQNIHCESRKL